MGPIYPASFSGANLLLVSRDCMKYHPKNVKDASKKWPNIFSQMVVENGGCMNYHPSFFHSRGRLLRKLPNPSQCEKWSGAKKNHVVACLRVHTNLWNLHQKLVLRIGQSWPSQEIHFIESNLLDFFGFFTSCSFQGGLGHPLGDGVPRTKTLGIAGGWSKFYIRGMDPINLVKLYSIWLCHHPTEITISLMVGFRVSVSG